MYRPQVAILSPPNFSYLPPPLVTDPNSIKFHLQCDMQLQVIPVNPAQNLIRIQGHDSRHLMVPMAKLKRYYVRIKILNVLHGHVTL